jgi:hypothetical protein
MLVDLKSVLKLHSVRFVKYCGYVYDPATRSWDHPDICPDNSASYGDFTEANPDTTDPELLYVIHDLMTYSDYSNGRVIQESNYRAFLVECENEEDNPNAIIRLHGGYDTNALAIKVSKLTESMLECLHSLEDYPILDEQIMGELELEGQDEAWTSWVRDDFIKGLEKKLGIEFADSQEDKIVKLFWETSEMIGEYWFEDGCSQYIRVEKLVEKIELSDLQELGLEYVS